MSIEFLVKVLPWPGADEPGYINLHWMERGRPGMSGRPVSSPNHLYEQRHFYSADNKPRDFYICLSRQSQFEQKTSQSGKPYRSAVRRHENVLALKSLYVDLDTKHYESPKAALVDFQRFTTEANLPWPNAIVYSGGGFHFYWAMSEAISLDQWQPLANALSEAIKRYKLVGADTQCTVDAARVLRLPPTLNHKYDPPRKVEVKHLDEKDFSPSFMAEKLTAYMVATNSTSLKPTTKSSQFAGLSATGTQVSNNLAAGIEPMDYKVQMADLVHECPLVVDAVKTGGQAYANPLWNLTTFLATFLEDGRSMAHLMARKHPGYTQESTDALYDRKEQERTQRNMGWPTCKAMSDAGSKLCQACPNFAQGKSPLHFANKNGKVVSKTTSAIILPEGYYVNPHGLIVRDLGDEEKNFIVYHRPITDPSLEVINEQLCFVMKAPMRVIVPTELTGNQHQLTASLHGQGMMTDAEKKEPPRVGRLISMWVTKLQEAKDAVRTTPCGWEYSHNKRLGFVFDGNLYTKTGIRQASFLPGSLQKLYTKMGDEEPWRDAVTTLKITRPEDMALLATAFASPLVGFTGQDGLILSVYSPLSAAGKTTTAKIAHAVWGDPKQGMQRTKDTNVSVEQKLSQLGPLPGYWDEPRFNQDTVDDLIFSITSGRGKMRADRNANVRKTGMWDCLVVFMSNESMIRNLVSRGKMTDAGALRVFEFEAAPLTEEDKLSSSLVGRLTQRLNHNFGHIGTKYAAYLGENYDEVEGKLIATSAEYETLTGNKSGERFWVATMATIETGAYYANKLEFVDIDLPVLRSFLFKSLGIMRAECSDQVKTVARIDDLTSIYTQFKKIAQGDRHWIVTETATPKAENIKFPRNYVSLGFKDLWGHTILSLNVDRVSVYAFTEWLEKEKYNPYAIIKAMIARFGVTKPGRYALGAGTDYANPTESILMVPLSRLPMSDVPTVEE